MDAWGALFVVYTFYCAFLLVGELASAGGLGSGKQQVYVTSKAAGKVEDLWCYTCETMEQDDRCVDLSSNHSSMIRKCPEDHRVCSVKRITYTTTTAENTTSRMWSLARSCSHKCEAGCIVVGERTKLYACTACCETSLCNVMTGGAGGRAGGGGGTRAALLTAAVLAARAGFGPR